MSAHNASWSSSLTMNLGGGSPSSADSSLAASSQGGVPPPDASPGLPAPASLPVGPIVKRRARSYVTALLLLFGGAFAPGSGCSCGRSDDDSCRAGTEGCRCMSGDLPCRGDLVCESGRCREAPCVEGSEGCPCLPGNECGVATSEGMMLVCDAGTCTAQACVEGALGCACLPDGSCTHAEAACNAGLCMRRDCSPGALHCPCDAGGGCAEGLLCQNGAICVGTTGFAGGACFADRTCRQGNSCTGGVCVPCDVGSLFCSCFTAGLCSAGAACVGGTCVLEPSDVMPVPAAPRCYSPCREDVELADGTVVACDAEELMPLCPDRTTCVQGSCVAAGEHGRSCASDVDCPDFQVCIQGRCYSNCEVDANCMAGLTCHRKVCRLPCRASGAECARGQHCITLDGENGFCGPSAAPEGAPACEVAGSFEVTPDRLQFTNLKVSGTFQIINRSPRTVELTVRKLQHVEPRAGGPLYVDTNPLHWLRMGVKGAASPTQSFKVLVNGKGGTAEIELTGAANEALSSWDGTLVVEGTGLGARRVSLHYVERPDGRWAGKLYYFTSFGDHRLDEYLAAGRSEAAAANVGNALVQRWSAFRHGRLRALEEWLAVLTATRTGSWSFASTRQRCPDRDGACYLHEGGISVYTENEKLVPIPAGMVEFPFVMHLRGDPADGTGATFAGRIDTAHTLQYPANPAVSVRFAGEPTSCSHTWEGLCLLDLAAVDPAQPNARVLVGGRYASGPEDLECAGHNGFALSRTPWLVPGFAKFTSVDAKSGLRYRYECRDALLPFGAGGSDPEAQRALNLSFAQANPVPDGRTRRRDLQFIDGALINNDTLFILFRETFISFLSPNPADDFDAYGYILLQRSAADLEPADFVGTVQQDPRTAPSALGVQCDAAVLGKIKDGSGTPIVRVTASNASLVASALLDGVASAPPPADFIAAGGPPYVHYLCVSALPVVDGTGKVTGSRAVSYFDGGPGSLASQGSAAGDDRACPAGSTVRYFVMNTWQDANLAALPCQQSGTCEAVLASWEANCEAGDCLDGLRLDPLWRCTDDAVHCDDDRLDLRAGKQFYKVAPSVSPVFVPLRAEIDDAFRYRSRFRSREGTGLGFAPSLCASGSNALPYCYDSPAIEEAAARADCLASLFDVYATSLTPGVAARVLDFLKTSFSCEEDASGQCVADGFERLYSELVIMLGDDAYTSAAAARFDLAGSAIHGFEGPLFEPNGINLSGGAGFEMFELYRSTQYYQAAVDRFYSLLPYVWNSINATDAGRQYVRLGTVTSYLDRVVRASVQKTRAWSEVAERYQSFNRPDLARRVVERAYSSAYMESVILGHLMLRMKNVVTDANRPQVADRVRLAALGYGSALLQMRKVYDDFTDDVSYFGFAPDYVPFPALEAEGGNAFEVLFASAKQKALAAADKEERALAADRSYDTDAVSFQNELTRIRLNYEGQLAEICGTFTGDDGRVYPALPKYAYLNERAKLLGNPCGFVGNGGIYQALSNVTLLGLDLRTVLQAAANVHEEISIEGQRVTVQCNSAIALANFQYEKAGDLRNLQDDVNEIRDRLATADRTLNKVESLANLVKCFVGMGGSDCAGAAAAAGIIAGAHVINELAHKKNDGIIRRKQREIADLQAEVARYTTGEHQCTVLKADSTARINTIALRLHELDLEALKAEYRIGQALSEVQKLRGQAQRLLSEQEEMEQQTINLEAARNDPNVRIYKNDAILTAKRTFATAVREAYKATKVFEYYTSQSYAALGDLFLVRMVAHGDISLESYLDGLEDAYYQFGEQFGRPDLRVNIVSLRDDVMQIPRFDANNRALGHAERVRLFRERLVDPALLDGHGYTTVPFSTTFESLSPLTRNHKIAYIEAEMLGSEVGDTVGRVYLRQRGTGVVRGVGDDTSFYAFAERTAVLDPFFNGQRVFGPEVYRNARLRDRPLVNTRWEAVINQRDERVNQDIDLNSLSDVRFYVYYTDFTPF